jgi:hypothetical protein
MGEAKRKRDMVWEVHEIGAKAGELLEAFAAHYAADCNFGSTLFAVYGVASPLGRLLDRGLNSLVPMYLNSDFRWVGGFWMAVRREK